MGNYIINMKLSSVIAIAALLGASVDEVAAIRRHHHHHRPHLVQIGKVDDIHTNDPKFAELQKKKVALQDAIEEETGPKELTEEEEKEKFEKELKGLEREGEKVKAASQLKDAKKSLAKLVEEEKLEGTKQGAKKAKLEAMIPALEEKQATLATETVAEDTGPANEETEKVKDLKKSLKSVEAQQKSEEIALDRVQDKLKSMFDEKPKEPEVDLTNPVMVEKKKKPDLSAFKANMAKIDAEEEEREKFLEDKAAAKAAEPKNPAVEASELAEEAAQEAKEKAAAAAKEAEEAAAAEKAAKLAAHKAAAKERDATIRASGELWTANMPGEYLEGYVQTKVNEIRYQLAQIEARENDSDSDSDSDSSDDE